MRSESLPDMFLAPTGAQGVTPSVCLYGTKSAQKALSKHSECTQNTLRALSKLFCEAHVCILVYVKLLCESLFLTYNTDCWVRIKRDLHLQIMYPSCCYRTKTILYQGYSLQ